MKLEIRLVEAILYVLPAYCANGAPVLFTRWMHVLHPIDMGLRFIDGRRVLGDGKTFEGLLVGVASGLTVGLGIYAIVPQFYRTLVEVMLLTVGAMAGDVLGAFIKRRMGLNRGAPAPVLDQLSFLVTALLLIYLTVGLPGWLNAETLLGIAAFTALLHVGTNYGAYKLGLKDRPW